MSKSVPFTPNDGVRHGELLDGGGRRRRRPADRPGGDVVRPTNIRLWLPLTPLWIVLAPFALLFAPLIALAPRLIPDTTRETRAVRGTLQVHPYRAAWALGAVLFSLSGMVVHIDTNDAHIHIRIL